MTNYATLRDLRRIIREKDSLPLSWVVEHGDKFQYAWMMSIDPVLMIEIAGHVTPRPQFVLAVAAIARIGMKYAGEYYTRAKKAIEAAETWAGNPTSATADLVLIEARSLASLYDDDTSRYQATQAASYAAHTARSAATTMTALVADDGILTIEHVCSAASIDVQDGGIEAEETARLRSARIIRKYIHPTVADLVRAGKKGWET